MDVTSFEFDCLSLMSGAMNTHGYQVASTIDDDPLSNWIWVLLHKLGLPHDWCDCHKHIYSLIALHDHHNARTCIFVHCSNCGCCRGL